MKVVIVNQHSGNFGDDAAGCALIKMLLGNSKVESIDLIYNATPRIPIDDKRVFHNDDIRFSKAGFIQILIYFFFSMFGVRVTSGEILKRWVSILRRADVVFIAPSGANIGIYKDWKFLFRVLMVVIEKKTPIFHYNTIGKSGNWVFDKIAKFVLSKSNIYVREKKTEQFIKEMGFKCKMGPDTAFALDSLNEKVRKEVVAFIPSSFDDWHPDYKNNPSDECINYCMLEQLATWVKNNNFKIEILPHLCSKDEQRNNFRIAEKLRQMDVGSVIVREDILTMWDYDYAISTSRFVIGMRYHAIVLAAKNTRPFSALCYENKMWEVCEYLDCRKLGIDINEFRNKAYSGFVEQLNELLLSETDIVDRLKKIVNFKLKPQTGIPIQENIVADDLE